MLLKEEHQTEQIRGLEKAPFFRSFFWQKKHDQFKRVLSA